MLNSDSATGWPRSERANLPRSWPWRWPTSSPGLSWRSSPPARSSAPPSTPRPDPNRGQRTRKENAGSRVWRARQRRDERHGETIEDHRTLRNGSGGPKLAPLIGSRGSSDFIRASGPSARQQAGHVTEGRQPFTAEIKTLTKGPIRERYSSASGDTLRSRGVTNETDVPDCGRRRKPFVTRAMAALPRWRIH